MSIDFEIAEHERISIELIMDCHGLSWDEAKIDYQEWQEEMQGYD